VQDEFLKQYREKYPPSAPALSPASEETHVPPPGYSDSADHFANFFEAVRTRKPVVEDAVFGLRAAGPALLSNLSYFESRIYTWDSDALSTKTESKS